MADHSKGIIRRASDGFVSWCADNSAAAKLERTVAQGVIGVAVGALAGEAGAPPEVQTHIRPVPMALLSPIQARIGASLAVAPIVDGDSGR